MTTTDPAIGSPLGYGLSWTYCTAVLPMVDVNGNESTITVTTIQPPLGLGTDSRTGRTLASCVSGRRCFAEAVIRRLSCARGCLPDTKIPTATANYGIDLLDEIGGDHTTAGVAMLSARIDSQIRQDERAVASQTVCTFASGVLLVPINLIDGAGPFRLTMSIDTLSGDTTVLASP